MRKTSDIMLVLTKQTDTDYENYTDKMREEIDEFEGALMDYRVHGNILTRDKLIAEAYEKIDYIKVLLERIIENNREQNVMLMDILNEKL